VNISHNYQIVFVSSIACCRRACRPIDVVSEKEVVAARRISVDVEVTQKILVLAVYVATDCHRHAELQQHRLLEEDGSRQHAQLSD